MSKITPEERKARAAEFLKERDERNRRLPFGRMAYLPPDHGVIVLLEEGEEWIKISQRGEWAKSRIPPDIWQDAYIRPKDLEELATFISALTARYNYLAERANKAANGCRLDTLQTIPTPPESEPA